MVLFLNTFQDVRLAIAQARRTPAFTACAILLVAVSCGGLVSAISLLNATALRRIPVPAADEIVAIAASDEKGQQTRPIFFETLAAIRSASLFREASLYAGGGILYTEARGITGEGAIEAVTPGFHESLGLAPHLGRFFDTNDAPGDADARPVAVIGYRFWERYYGADPKAIGERLLINRVPFTVIGVTPPNYRGLYLEIGFDFSIPLAVLGRQLATNQYPIDRKAALRGQHIIARVRPGAELRQLRADLSSLWSRLRLEVTPPGLSAPERAEFATQQVTLESLSSGFSTLRARYGHSIALFSVVAAIAAAIAALNLAGLLLSRHAARANEVLVHRALGASTGRLARRMLIESIALAVAGTVVGIGIGRWGSQVVTSLLWTSSVPLNLDTMPDGTVIAYAMLGAVVLGTFIGSLPVLALVRQSREISPGTRTTTRRVTPWTKGLVVAEVALSLTLTSLAAGFAVTLYSLRQLDPGVDGAELRWTRLYQLPGGYQGMQDDTYYPELVRTLAATRGIESAALSHHFPAFFNFPALVTTFPVAPATSDDPGAATAAIMESISPRFFDTVGIPVIRGRDFDWRDDRTRPGVAMVNAALAAVLFGDGDAVGRRIRVGDDTERRALEIVAVVGNATIGGYRSPRQPAVFRPKLQEPRFARSPVLLYRTSLPAAAADRAVSEIVHQRGREHVRQTFSFQEQIDIALINERLSTGLASALAGMSILIGGLGLFAVLAYTVSTRTREIALRVAVGASAVRVVGMILFEGLTLVALGIAVGVGTTLLGMRVARSFFEMAAGSLWPTIFSAALFVLLAALACVVPARRAAGISASAALRNE